MRLKVGHGNIHGPMRPHPTLPKTFMIAIGATYYLDGRHVAGGLSEEHAALNLVSEIKVELK